MASASVDATPSKSAVDADGEYFDLLSRLNRASVSKSYRAFEDIPWDDADYRIDPADPRWIQAGFTLKDTAWFQQQPPDVQSCIALHMTVTFMKFGAQFENVLSRGLLGFAGTLPNHSPEYRYAYHEVIEESHHSLMFQEFVNRSGLEVVGLSARVQRLASRVVTFGRTFPELFFIYVLGGEDPIDYQQRTNVLGSDHNPPPILRRVSQIHVTEEARHISFATAYLRRNVPKLSATRMLRLRMAAPMILGLMARIMLQPSETIVRRYGIPDSVLREAYHDNPVHHEARHASLARLAALCRELRVLVPPYDRLWRRQDLIGN